jgi:hypothetical protein
MSLTALQLGFCLFDNDARWWFSGRDFIKETKAAINLDDCGFQ